MTGPVFLIGSAAATIISAGRDPGSAMSSGAVFPGLAAVVVLLGGTAFTRTLQWDMGDVVRGKLVLTLLSFGVSIGLSAVGSGVLLPLFAGASATGRILIRLLLFPLLVEALLLLLRMACRVCFGQGMPAQNALVVLLPTMLVGSMLGRFLCTNLESIWETVGVSLALAAIEALLRFTMAWRDAAATALCRRHTGGGGGGG